MDLGIIGFTTSGKSTIFSALTGTQTEAAAVRRSGLEHNLAVGFHFLKALIAEHGEQAGFAAYNGSGPAADAYGAHGVALTNEFRSIIG